MMWVENAVSDPKYQEGNLPTKRQFDLVVLVVILANPVRGLFKMWATRKAASNDPGVVSNVVAGAVKIAS